jgi:hypothetical protein
MNVVGVITLALAAACWAGGVLAWFYGAYHMIMVYVRWWQTVGTSRGRVEKFFALGMLGFRSDLAPRPLAHLRKARRGGAVFLGLVALVFLNGLIGTLLGGWQHP